MLLIPDSEFAPLAVAPRATDIAKPGIIFNVADGSWRSDPDGYAQPHTEKSLHRLLCAVATIFAVLCLTVRGAELSSSELELKKLLGPATPEPIALWPGESGNWLLEK